MIKNILNSLIPNKIWLASVLIFLTFILVIKGGLHNQELIINSGAMAGDFSYLKNSILLNLFFMTAPLVSLLATIVASRKNFTRLEKVANHLHWLMFVFLIIGSQFLKGEN